MFGIQKKHAFFILILFAAHVPIAGAQKKRDTVLLPVTLDEVPEFCAEVMDQLERGTHIPVRERIGNNVSYRWNAQCIDVRGCEAVTTHILHSITSYSRLGIGQHVKAPIMFQLARRAQDPVVSKSDRMERFQAAIQNVKSGWQKRGTLDWPDRQNWTAYTRPRRLYHEGALLNAALDLIEQLDAVGASDDRYGFTWLWIKASEEDRVREAFGFELDDKQQQS